MVKKGIIAWIASGVFVNLWGGLTCWWLFRWIYFVEPTNIYRASVLYWTMPGISLLSLNNMLLTGVFVLVYAILYNGIPGKGLRKGLVFGFLLWLAGWLIPVIRFAITINTSAALITYWLMDGLVIYLLIGAITGAIYKR